MTAMYIVGVLTILSSLGVIGCTRPLNSALCLVLTLFFVAALYAMLGAHFIAVIQILVYAGAIMVLVVFVIMLLGAENDSSGINFRQPQNLLIAAVAGAFVGMLIFAFKDGVAAGAIGSGGDAQLIAELENAHAVGQVLFTRYVFPLQVAGLLLLAAIVGAVVLAQEPKRPLAKGRGLSAIRKREEAEV